MMSSEYMLTLHKTLSEKTYGDPPKTLSPTTVNAYIKTLYNLNDKKPFKNLAFLKNTDDISKKLSEYAESTQKTLYATITSILSLNKGLKGYAKTYAFYQEKMKEKADIANKADTSVKTDTQKDNWLNWDDVLKVKEELKQKVTEDANTKDLSPTQEINLLTQLLVSLYTDIAPRRNQDYLNMYVFNATKRDKVDDLPKDKNYLIVSSDKTPRQFIFNIYKTSKKYGQQQVNVPSALAETITYYLKRFANKEKEYKFLPIFKDNAITRILNKAFGKKVGSSMLRHSYLSSKYDVSEMKDTADKMAHSLTEQRKYVKAD